MPTRTHIKRKTQGSVAFGLLAVVSLFILGNVLTMNTIHQRVLQDRVEGGAKGLALAEAGVALALWEFNYGGSNFDEAVDGWQICAGQTSDTCVEWLDFEVHQAVGAVDVRVLNRTSSTPEVQTTGQVSGTGVSAGLVVQLADTGGGFAYAAALDKTTPIAGNFLGVVDSYDSTLGNYNPASPRLNGDVATNSIGASSLALVNGWIKGDAYVGPGGNPSSDINIIGGGVTGAKATLSSAITLESVSMPAVGECTELGTVTLNSTDGLPANDTLFLAPGVYCVTVLKLLGGNTQLQASDSSGPVKLYIRDWVYAEGLIQGGNGAGGFPVPEKMQLYFADGGSTVPDGTGFSVWPSYDCQDTRTCMGRDNTVPGDGDPKLVGTVYTPDGSVKLAEGAQLFGAIAADQFSLIHSTASMHYDEHLSSLMSDYGTTPHHMEVSSWQRTPG